MLFKLIILFFRYKVSFKRSLKQSELKTNMKEQVLDDDQQHNQQQDQEQDQHKHKKVRFSFESNEIMKELNMNGELSDIRWSLERHSVVEVINSTTTLIQNSINDNDRDILKNNNLNDNDNNNNDKFNDMSNSKKNINNNINDIEDE